MCTNDIPKWPDILQNHFKWWLFHQKLVFGPRFTWNKRLDLLMSFFIIFRKGRFLAVFRGVSRLWGQFWVSKLHLIDSTIESAIFRHALRNISGYRLEKIGPPRPEVQGKTWHFQKVKLWGQVSPGSFAANWNPPGHVVYPTSFTPGNWNFYDISTYKNVAFLGLPGPFEGRISPEPQDTSKISKAGHFGDKNHLKTHSKHFPAVWEKKKFAKEQLFLRVKIAPSGGPWAPPYGPGWRKEGFQSWFWPKTNAWSEFRQNRARAADSLYSKLSAFYVQSLLSNKLFQLNWAPACTRTFGRTCPRRSWPSPTFPSTTPSAERGPSSVTTRSGSTSSATPTTSTSGPASREAIQSWGHFWDTTRGHLAVVKSVELL